MPKISLIFSQIIIETFFERGIEFIVKNKITQKRKYIEVVYRVKNQVTKQKHRTCIMCKTFSEIQKKIS